MHCGAAPNGMGQNWGISADKFARNTVRLVLQPLEPGSENRKGSGAELAAYQVPFRPRLAESRSTRERSLLLLCDYSLPRSSGRVATEGERPPVRHRFCDHVLESLMTKCENVIGAIWVLTLNQRVLGSSPSASTIFQ